jgi:hypothetical protein
MYSYCIATLDTRPSTYKNIRPYTNKITLLLHLVTNYENIV